jgi:hypothetical protein
LFTYLTHVNDSIGAVSGDALFWWLIAYLIGAQHEVSPAIRILGIESMSFPLQMMDFNDIMRLKCRRLSCVRSQLAGDQIWQSKPGLPPFIV